MSAEPSNRRTAQPGEQPTPPVAPPPQQRLVELQGIAAREIIERRRAEQEATELRERIAVIVQANREVSAMKGDYLGCARELVGKSYTSNGYRALIFWRDEFMRFLDGRYVAIAKSEIRAAIYSYIEDRGNKAEKKLVSELLGALEAVTILGARVEPACWLDSERSASDLLICSNGAFDLATGTHHPLGPNLFTLTALPVAYDPAAPAPMEWLKFLHTLWPGDAESIATLQEIGGLLLTGETKFQKLFLVVGPRRSGKGTILRTLAALQGDGNFAAPTLSSLGGRFGLQPLIGKLAAFIGDARLGTRADMAVIAERLLSISGEDHVSVERKNTSDYVGRLPVRFVLSTNELPRLTDASGALASRFVILKLTESFYGREDLGLQQRLNAELPGILNWCITGRQRLLQRGYFVQPVSSREAVQQLEDLGSPISAFLRDRCEIGPGFQCAVTDLYGAWRDWCQAGGRDHFGTQQMFGRDLSAACPGIKTVQPRGPHGGRYRAYEGIRLARTGTHANASLSLPNTFSREDQDVYTRVPSRAKPCSACDGEGCDWCGSNA